MPPSVHQVYRKQADPDDALRLCRGWLNYAIEYLQFKKWPIRMARICLQRGPTNIMRPRDVVRLMLFFYGNNLTYICAGHWALLMNLLCLILTFIMV